MRVFVFHVFGAVAQLIFLPSVEAFCVPGLAGTGRTCRTCVRPPQVGWTVSASAIAARTFRSAKKNGKLESGDFSSSSKKYGSSDFTKATFQNIKNDRAELELFRIALLERLQGLNYGEERENLAVLKSLVESQLELIFEDEADAEELKPKKTYKPASFTTATYKEIVNDFDELQHFQTALQNYLTSRKENEKLSLLSTVVKYRIEELRKGSLEKLNRASSFVYKLMTTEIEDIDQGNGMRVMKDLLDCETGRKYNLIIRNVTEPFWQACLDTVDEPHRFKRVCAVGTPGIGKTLTTSFLIRMLLMRGKTVVYHIKASVRLGRLYEFCPALNSYPGNSGSGEIAAIADSIKVTIYSEKDFVQDMVPSLGDGSTYYIVDPGESKVTCNPDSEFQAKVIIVASPDSRHWGEEEFEKQRLNGTGVFKYYPLWKYDEILTAAPFMEVELSEEVISDRFRLVGGVPRRIFVDDDGFHRLLEKVKTSADLLTEEQSEKIIREEYPDLDTKESSQPRGFVMGYLSEGPSFSNRTVQITSTAAEELVYFKHMKKLWKTMLDLGNLGGGGVAFEAYARYLVFKGVDLFYEQLFFTQKESNPSGKVTFKRLFGGCKEIRLIANPVEAAKSNAEILFHSSCGTFPLIDFIYQDATGHFHAFQATLAETHSVSVELIRQYERELGAENFSLYYLIPSENEKKFRLYRKSKDTENLADIDCAIFQAIIPDPSKEFRPVFG